MLCRADVTPLLSTQRYSLCPRPDTAKSSWQLIVAIVHKVASSSWPIPCFMLSCQADEAVVMLVVCVGVGVCVCARACASAFQHMLTNPIR